jgi:hypothetical protein
VSESRVCCYEPRREDERDRQRPERTVSAIQHGAGAQQGCARLARSECTTAATIGIIASIPYYVRNPDARYTPLDERTCSTYASISGPVVEKKSRGIFVIVRR